SQMAHTKNQHSRPFRRQHFEPRERGVGTAPPARLYGRLSAATGAGHTMAGATSCSDANVAARRVFFMLGTFMIASAFSPAANALGLLISQRWATGGIALLVG